MNIKRRSIHIFFSAVAIALALVVWLGLKHSYVFAVRADATCDMRLHSVRSEPKSKFLLVFHTPVSGVTTEESLTPNVMTFYVLRFSGAAHPEVAISARTQDKPTWRVQMDDEEIERSKATGGIIEFSVSKEALKCAISTN